MTKQQIKHEIEKVIEKDENGKFKPVDLSFEGVNAWRKSMGLPTFATVEEWQAALRR